MSDQLISSNGKYRLLMQNDGNAVVYRIADDKVISAMGQDPDPHPGPPPGPDWPTGDDVTNVRDNFCNLQDSIPWKYGSGETKPLTIFSPFIAGLDDAGFDRWAGILRDNGSTHMTIAPNISYSSFDYPVPGVQMLDKPDVFRAFVLKVLNTPSASGKGFCPIIMLDEGKVDPRTRIDAYWRPLLDAIKDLLPHCIVTPGWEVIKASEWRSSDLSYALEWLGGYGIPHLWLHLSEGRAAGSSNPIEPDDPWQGAERDFWYTHGGQYPEGLLYQSYTIRNGDTINCDPVADDCWLNRWTDVLIRVGNGVNGWRKMHLCLFEAPGYYAIRGDCTSDLARQWARAGRDLAASYGVTISHGNGLP